MWPNERSPFWWAFIFVCVLISSVWAVSTGYREGWVARTDIEVVGKILMGFMPAVSYGLWRLVGKRTNGNDK